MTNILRQRLKKSSNHKRFKVESMRVLTEYYALVLDKIKAKVSWWWKWKWVKLETKCQGQE